MSQSGESLIHMNNLIECLRELSSHEFQSTVWTGKSKDQNIVSTFGELVCQLFDDTGLSDVIEERRFARIYQQNSGCKTPLQRVQDLRLDCAARRM